MRILFLIVLALSFTGLSAFGGVDDDQEFLLNNRLNSGTAHQVQLGSKLKEASTVKAVWDASVGNLGSSTINNGSHELGVSLPAGAIITRSYIHVVTAVVGAGALGTSTVAFQCEDAGNIKSAADVTVLAADSLTVGAADDALANFQKGIAAECDIKAVLVNPAGDYSAGKINVFVDYVDSE